MRTSLTPEYIQKVLEEKVYGRIKDFSKIDVDPSRYEHLKPVLKDYINANRQVFKRVGIEEMRHSAKQPFIAATYGWRINEFGVPVADLSEIYIGKCYYIEDAFVSQDKPQFNWTTQQHKPVAGVLLTSAMCYPRSMSSSYEFPKERISERLIDKQGNDTETTIGAIYYRVFVSEEDVNMRGLYMLTSDRGNNEQTDYSDYYSKKDENWD